MTLAPVVVDKPIGGVHTYVVAPFAINVMLGPKQTEGAVGDNVIVGVEFTIIVAEAVLTIPLTSVPVTV